MKLLVKRRSRAAGQSGPAESEAGAADPAPAGCSKVLDGVLQVAGRPGDGTQESVFKCFEGAGGAP